MRILLAGDTHMDLEHLQYLVRTAQKEKCDRVFVLGDFGYFEHMEEGRKFLDKLDRYCNVTNMPVYFLDGNHDKTSLIVANYMDAVDPEGFLRVRGYVRYARRGHRWTWDGANFIALGGAYSIDKDVRLEWERKQGKGPGRHWFPEEEITDAEFMAIMDEIKALDPIPDIDIMLAHDMPRGATPWMGFHSIPGGLQNQNRLRYAIENLLPARFYHGHLHHAYQQIIEYIDEDGVRHECYIEGLGCNSKAMPYGPQEIRERNSWTVFDTEKFNADR